MILGIGTDILAVSRMAAALERRGESLGERLLHPLEMQRWQQHELSVSWLAKRFAAKEALLKALGTGLRAGISWHDMIILPDELGRPEVTWQGQAATRLEKLGTCRTLLTLSDEQHYVVAFAVIEAVQMNNG